MRVKDLKALAKERRLRYYSILKKDELIALLQDNQPTRTRPTRPTTPSPLPPQLVRFRPDRPRQPELLRQEIDIFEQQEMRKKVTSYKQT